VPKLHGEEVDTGVALVRRLLRAQERVPARLDA
jgi:hypothetical protein